MQAPVDKDTYQSKDYCLSEGNATPAVLTEQSSDENIYYIKKILYRTAEPMEKALNCLLENCAHTIPCSMHTTTHWHEPIRTSDPIPRTNQQPYIYPH